MEEATYDLVEIKKQHFELGQLLIQRALDAIKEGKIKPKTWTDIRESIVIGIKIQRLALGLDVGQL